MNKYTKHIVLLILLLSSIRCLSQRVDQEQTMKFVTADGNEYVGRLTAQNDSTYTVLTKSLGEILLMRIDVTSIVKYDIQRLNQLSVDTTGTYSWKNKMANRNFYTETAFSVEQGRWQYQNLMAFGQLFSYGVSDGFTLTLGTELLSIFNRNTPSVLVQPKFVFSEPSDNFHFGIGSNILLYPSGNGSDVTGSLFGISTIGNTDNNLTFGAGFSYSDSQIASTPLLQLGGTARLGDGFGITGDFLVGFGGFNSNEDFGTISIRLYYPKVNIDLGFVTANFEYFFPAAGITVLLGN